MDSLYHTLWRGQFELLVDECLDVFATEPKHITPPGVLRSEADNRETWFLTTDVVVDPINGDPETRRNLPRRPKRLDDRTDYSEGKTLDGLIHITSSAIA
jgi:hypothetical protein